MAMLCPPQGCNRGRSITDYELQTGIIAEPSIASRGNGHNVVVYNSTEGRTFFWKRVNGDSDWMGVELL